MLNNKFHILGKYFNEQASKEEINLISEWLDKSIDNQLEYDLYKAIWEKSGKLYENEKTDLPKAWERISKRMEEVPVKIIKPNFYLKIAATIILLIGLGAAFYLFKEKLLIQNENLTEVITAIEIKQVNLPDGSSVWLNKNSKIKYPGIFSSKKRTVYFSGEGYFEVAKNPKKPFVVNVNGFNVEVLGTEFNINSAKMAGEVEVAVYQGKVAFYEKESKSEKLILEKNEKGTGNAEKLEKSEIVDPNKISWKTGKIVFNKSSIPELCKILSKHYNKKVQFDTNISYDGKELSATFESQNFEEVLEIICFTLDLNFSIDNDNVIIGME